MDADGRPVWSRQFFAVGTWVYVQLKDEDFFPIAKIAAVSEEAYTFRYVGGIPGATEYTFYHDQITGTCLPEAKMMMMAI